MIMNLYSYYFNSNARNGAIYLYCFMLFFSPNSWIFVVCQIFIWVWNTFHTSYFNFYVISVGMSIWHFVNCYKMHSFTMYQQTRTTIQPFLANMAFEMLGLLVSIVFRRDCQYSGSLDVNTTGH